MAKKSITKAVKDFWYGKPHSAEEGGRRLGELYEDKTGLLKHREWRGVKDTFYYMYNIWGYNYVHMVLDILKFSNNPIDFVKGTWRYRWMGQTYLPVIHWFERGLQGMRPPRSIRFATSSTPTPVCTAARRTTLTSTPSTPTRRPAARCSIPGRTPDISISRWR